MGGPQEVVGGVSMSLQVVVCNDCGALTLEHDRVKLKLLFVLQK